MAVINTLDYLNVTIKGNERMIMKNYLRGLGDKNIIWMTNSNRWNENNETHDHSTKLYTIRMTDTDYIWKER